MNEKSASEEKSMPWYIEIPMVVVLTLVFIFVIQTFIGRLYVIPSASMEPTLHGQDGKGDRIFVEKVSYYFSDPEPGMLSSLKAQIRGTQALSRTALTTRQLLGCRRCRPGWGLFRKTRTRW